ncbi:MAG: hypothetical protein ACOCM4_15070 [Acetivibrio ethanolgignens]
MTNQEAIKTLKIAKAEVEWNYPMDYAVAIETAIEALEKQIPKKPVKKSFIIPYEGINVCPSCKEPLGGKKYYCCECGQKLDWSEGKAKE